MSSLVDPFKTHFYLIDESPYYDQILDIQQKCIHIEMTKPKTPLNHHRLQSLYKQIYSLLGLYNNKNSNGKRYREHF